MPEGSAEAEDHPSNSTALGTTSFRFHQSAWDLADVADEDWDAADDEFWDELLTSRWRIRYEIWTHTYSFPLVTYLPKNGVQVIKFSSRQETGPVIEGQTPARGQRSVWAASQLGLRPKTLVVPMPGAEQAARSHLRVSVPDGLEWSGVGVSRVTSLLAPTDGAVPSSRWDRVVRWWSLLWRMQQPDDRSDEECKTVLTPDRAHVYTGDLGRRRVLRAHLAVHVPFAGFLRAALLSTLLSLITIVAGLALHDDLGGDADSNVDAAVALLLLAPTLLSAYLVRPTEHALLSESLRWIRYLVVLSMLTVYTAAGASLLYLSDDPGRGCPGRRGT